MTLCLLWLVGAQRLQSFRQLFLCFWREEHLWRARTHVPVRRGTHVNDHSRRAGVVAVKVLRGILITGSYHLNRVLARGNAPKLYVSSQRCSLTEDLAHRRNQ